MSKHIKTKRKDEDIVRRYIVRGGKEYEQRKIVLSQFYRILDVMCIGPGEDEADRDAVAKSDVSNLPLLLAIILNEPGQPPCEEDQQEALAKKLACIIDLETQTQMIEDFMQLNDFKSVAEAISKVEKKIWKGTLN